MLRKELTDALKIAMVGKDERTTSTIRMINAKIKDKDIEARPKGNMDGISDDDIRSLLQGMIKQRKESIELYKQGNRPDLVAQESEEITVIERFLPKQMSTDEAKAAISKMITAIGAKDIKDMGKIMGELKKTYAGQMDFSEASTLVKQLLSAA